MVRFEGLHGLVYAKYGREATLYYEAFSDQPELGIFGDDVRWRDGSPLSQSDRESILADVVAILQWKGFPAGVVWRAADPAGR